MSFCPSCPRSAVRPEGRAALTNRLSLVSVSFVSVSAVSHYYYYYYDYYCGYDYDYDDYLLLAFLSVSQPVSRERQRLRFCVMAYVICYTFPILLADLGPTALHCGWHLQSQSYQPTNNPHNNDQRHSLISSSLPRI